MKVKVILVIFVCGVVDVVCSAAVVDHAKEVCAVNARNLTEELTWGCASCLLQNWTMFVLNPRKGVKSACVPCDKYPNTDTLRTQGIHFVTRLVDCHAEFFPARYLASSMGCGWPRQ